ncbi:MAG: serine/threonine protein kinase [Myxococcaceae bacterium]|nr:serine/threonine protein kinase [Myxococcaceae bacterium]
MAEVWLASAKGPGGFEKQVALKRVKRSLRSSLELKQLFLNEACLAARMSHPNVVLTHGLERIDGDAVLVMEHVDGPSCRRLLARELDAGLLLPVELACSIVAQACEGLGYVHRQGVLHLDVSPENLLVTSTGVVKLCDFGVARWAGEPCDDAWARGKPAYFAPERLDITARVDARADLYALGVTLFELLTGARPIAQRSGATFGAPRSGEQFEGCPAPRVSAARGDVPAELDALVAKLLVPEVERRPRSCGEVSEVLHAAGLVRPIGLDAELSAVLARS